MAFPPPVAPGQNVLASQYNALLGVTAGPWQTWTPTASCDPSMTITGVTFAAAQYFVMGKLVFFILNASGTLGGTASAGVYFTPPVAPVNIVHAVSGLITPGGGAASVADSYVNSGGIAFKPSPYAAYTLGACNFWATGMYSIP